MRRHSTATLMGLTKKGLVEYVRMAEYLQTKIRYDRLHKMCVGYEAGTLNFKPTCSLELLKEQKAAMGQYLHCLEIRAQIEGVELL